jgi:transcriptional regulator with XRE-family HTH domain
MTDKTLGGELKLRRELSGFTLREVEDATGVSNAYLSQLENNKIKKPSAHVLYKLANIYGVQLDTFLLAAGYINELQTTDAIANRLGILTIVEEQQLLDYLRFLRFKKSKNINT